MHSKYVALIAMRMSSVVHVCRVTYCSSNVLTSFTYRLITSQFFFSFLFTYNRFKERKAGLGRLLSLERFFFLNFKIQLFSCDFCQEFLRIGSYGWYRSVVALDHGFILEGGGGVNQSLKIRSGLWRHVLLTDSAFTVRTLSLGSN